MKPQPQSTPVPAPAKTKNTINFTEQSVQNAFDEAVKEMRQDAQVAQIASLPIPAEYKLFIAKNNLSALSLAAFKNLSPSFSTYKATAMIHVNDKAVESMKSTLAAMTDMTIFSRKNKKYKRVGGNAFFIGNDVTFSDIANRSRRGITYYDTYYYHLSLSSKRQSVLVKLPQHKSAIEIDLSDAMRNYSKYSNNSHENICRELWYQLHIHEDGLAYAVEHCTRYAGFVRLNDPELLSDYATIEYDSILHAYRDKATRELYHLGCNVWASFEDAQRIIKQAHEAFEKRKAEKIKIESIDPELVVTLRDSINSGNCEYGTRKFIHELAKHLSKKGGDIAEIERDIEKNGFKAGEILALRNDSFTKRAIQYAAKRNS